MVRVGVATKSLGRIALTIRPLDKMHDNKNTETRTDESIDMQRMLERPVEAKGALECSFRDFGQASDSQLLGSPSKAHEPRMT